MANVDRHNGAKPYGEAKRLTPYTAGGTVYPGDFVTLNSSGQIVAATASQTLQGVAAVYATSGNEILVWDDITQKYEVQDDGSATLAQSSVGLNFNIVANAGNSTFFRSRMELAANTGATTPATLPLRLIGFGREVNSDTSTVFMKCVVQINNAQVAPNTAGV